MFRLSEGGLALRWLGAIGAAVALLVAGRYVAPLLPLHPVGGYVVAFTAVSGSALAAAYLCPATRPRALWWLPIPLAALVAVRLTGGSGLDAAVPVTAALLMAGSVVGAVVGHGTEHPGHLLFVAIVSAAADVFSVFHPSGPSAAIAQSASALSVLALPWPLMGTHEIAPLLGVGDVVFATLYVAAARAHKLSLRRTMTAMAGAFLVTMSAVILLAYGANLEVPIPALPFLSVAMLIAHPEARKPPAADRRRGAVVAALVVLLVAALFIVR